MCVYIYRESENTPAMCGRYNPVLVVYLFGSGNKVFDYTVFTICERVQ